MSLKCLGLLKIVIIVLSFSATAHGLKCIACFYAQDVTKCGASTVCKDGEHCGIHTFSSGGNKRYHAGCITTEVCEGKQDAPIDIFGRRRRRQANTVSVECCDTDLCNTGLGVPATTKGPVNQQTDATTLSMSQTVTGSVCIDHEDCQVLLQSFPICNDSNTAMNICPKTCGKCGASATMTPLPTKGCVDESTDCRILIAHFRICKDLEFAMVKCQESCNLCADPTMPNAETPIPTQNRETPFATTTQARETPALTTVPMRETPFATTVPMRETPFPATVPMRETPFPATIPMRETPFATTVPMRETPFATTVPMRETPFATTVPMRETPFATSVQMRRTHMTFQSTTVYDRETPPSLVG